MNLDDYALLYERLHNYQDFANQFDPYFVTMILSYVSYRRTIALTYCRYSTTWAVRI